MEYFIFIISVMLILPVIFVLAEHFIGKRKDGIINLIGKWFVFWAIGIRLLVAGVNQSINPSFTAGLLQLDESAVVIIRELGFANVFFGMLAIISLFKTDFRLPATAGGYYMGLAGIFHVFRLTDEISFKETIALVSDLWIFLIMMIYCIGNLSKTNTKA